MDKRPKWPEEVEKYLTDGSPLQSTAGTRTRAIELCGREEKQNQLLLYLTDAEPRIVETLPKKSTLPNVLQILPTIIPIAEIIEKFNFYFDRRPGPPADT